MCKSMQKGSTFNVNHLRDCDKNNDSYYNAADEHSMKYHKDDPRIILFVCDNEFSILLNWYLAYWSLLRTVTNEFNFICLVVKDAVD